MSGAYFPVIGDYRISSGLGSRSSPGGIGSTNHAGIDIAAAAGLPVVAAVGGTVESARYSDSYGNIVDIRGADGNIYRYAHMQGFNVRAGQTIAGGAQIGAVGSTGNSTGNHLHFEIRDAAGRIINPSGLLSRAENLARGALSRGLEALTGGRSTGELVAAGANVILPGSGTVLEAAGIVGDCNLICQIQNWIKESGFFQRLAIAILAFIIIAAALFMLKSNIISQVSSKVKGAIA